MSGGDLILLIIAIFALYYLLTGTSCNNTKEGFAGLGQACRNWSGLSHDCERGLICPCEASFLSFCSSNCTRNT